MGLFNKKIPEEYRMLEQYASSLSALLRMDEYLSRKTYRALSESTAPAQTKLRLMQQENVLAHWCKKNALDRKKLERWMDVYDSTDTQIKRHNEEYVARHLTEEKEILDSLLVKDDPRILLDEEQRKVVLSDEDYTLVIAGAGAGKTTTIEAKVKYLVDRKGVDPTRILIVSFTKKATEELRERFERLDIPAKISTFHSIGYALLKEGDGKRKRVVDQGFMYRVIEDYLTTKLTDEWFMRKALLFFASYLNAPLDDKNMTLLFKSLEANDFATMKSELSSALSEYQKDLTRKKVTMREERVRSIDECRIANYLYIHGIDYVYEPVYPYSFHDTTKPYCPDFLIRQNGREIYLEHFGLSEDGTNSRFSADEQAKYREHVNDKIKLHREHGTELIYTFSAYRDGRDLITHLNEKLTQANIEMSDRSEWEIYRRLAENVQEKYFSKLITLLCRFIQQFKVSNFDVNTKFDEWQFSTKDERTKLFLEIAKQCFHVYEAKRMEVSAIDFEDMINDAVNLLDSRIENGDMLPYDYVLVDEYQDISLQRFDLCEKLSLASRAKIIAVGDDWQSIFAFAGAQIDLFTEFAKKMGYAEVLKITRTYRNSQELVDIAGSFVMENQKQIKKDLRSDKSIQDPVILMSYDDSYDKENQEGTPFTRMGKAIEKALDDMVAQGGEKQSVLLIGRYHFDGKNLAKLDDLFSWEGNRLRSKKYPKLDLSFMTAHASKGLGRDNVIILNGKDDVCGFPSKIEDDPVMKLVFKEDEAIDFEEERRLFYVALTRTKNRVYIVTPQTKPSKFILEIKEKFTNVTLRGVSLAPNGEAQRKFRCPICGYPLQRRESKLKLRFPVSRLWICSNDPEVCGFLTNDLRGNASRLSISKCPECHDGYLVVKPIRRGREEVKGFMLGCTNYREDGKGCNFTMMPNRYTQDARSILRDAEGHARVCLWKKDVEEVVSAMRNVESRLPYFRFGYRSLLRFLRGEADKALEAFRLQEEKGYGLLKGKTAEYAKSLLEALIAVGVLSEEKNARGFVDLRLSGPVLNDESWRLLSEVLSDA